MSSCPVCGKENTGAERFCMVCSFDFSRNYEQRRTVSSELPNGIVPISVLKARFKGEPVQPVQQATAEVPRSFEEPGSKSKMEAAREQTVGQLQEELVCPQCGGSHFSFLKDEMQLKCLACGTKVPLAGTPASQAEAEPESTPELNSPLSEDKPVEHAGLSAAGSSPGVSVHTVVKKPVWVLNLVLLIVLVPCLVIVWDFRYGPARNYFGGIEIMLPAILIPLLIIAALIRNNTWLKVITLLLGEAWGTFFVCSGVVGNHILYLLGTPSHKRLVDLDLSAGPLFILLAVVTAAISISTLSPKRGARFRLAAILLAMVWAGLFLVSGVFPSFYF